MWNRQQLWLIVVILLVDVASIFSISKYFDFTGTFQGIVLFQIIFFGLLTFGLFMGKKEWTRNKKPILLKIEKMLADFET